MATKPLTQTTGRRKEAIARAMRRQVAEEELQRAYLGAD